MELVMGRFAAAGVDTLIACAAAQSNKLREIAAAAARCGMRAILLINDEEAQADNFPLQGNRLLFDLLGAEIRRIESDHDTLAAEQEVAEQVQAAGGRPAILDRQLEYGLLATLAYVDAAEELLQQLRERDIVSERIFITAGAGMTTAGLVLGLAHHKFPGRVTGVCVARSATALKPEITGYANRAAAALGLDTRIGTDDFELDDRQLAPGYGIVTDHVRETIRFIATHHGMVPDPVYNAKTARALIDYARSRKHAAGDSCVYINTGGGTGLFAMAAHLLSR
jgi:1-aminocyclopropane-1-carboxylate deaminase/D-cysteine desulfhydrase-like pyridoxal-dependent ACC family enzyme